MSINLPVKPFLSDEEIYETLEKVVEILSKQGSKPEDVLPELQTTYTPRMSWAFFRACYWYLSDFDRTDITKLIGSSEERTDICMDIFSKYEPYLKANYERSLTDPDPYLLPEKAPDSSPGSKPRLYFSGGK
ncbi:hypothetical protein HYU08_00305 [Candidatus Woesearchaeota archaeon]|nr:hypothetical protein [Candidatus Woesearchaeota archaeon]